MNSEPKAFASLSSGLLARKGAARPAMRPQGFGQAAAGLEDLGWNDMGFEPPRPALAPVRDEEHDAFGEELSEPPLRSPLAGLTPVQSPVHDQQAEIVGRLAADEEIDEEEVEPAEAPADEVPAEEEFDETAELYEPEAEEEPIAALAPVIEFVAPAPAPARSPRHAAQPRRVPTSRAAPGAKGKAAFTLRLDPARHLKLRLACAVSASSAQILVTEALDALLAGMPELDAMAARANRKG